MNAASLLREMVLGLAGQLEASTSLALQQSDDMLKRWIRFQGLEGASTTEIIARQAALNLILKTLLCNILVPGELPDSASAMAVLAKADDAIELAGWDHLPRSYLDSVALEAGVSIEVTAVAGLSKTLQDNSKCDAIGTVYAAIVPQADRRTLGQFWTPPEIAEFMTCWAVRKPSDRVLDPGFGSGVFLLATIKRLFALGGSGVALDDLVTGVELSPLAFVMGAVNVLLRYPQARPYLRLSDFMAPRRLSVTESHAEALQPALPGIGPSGGPMSRGFFDVVVCNPPYTRHHDLPEAYKGTWAAEMKRQFGIRLSRLSSLFAYFFIQAARLLKPTGRMAFITPALVFEASYSRQVKEFIRRQLCLRAIVTFDDSMSVFEGVDTAACITLLEGRQASPVEQVIHVQIRQWPGVETLLKVVEKGATQTHEWGTVRPIAQNDLHPSRKWTVITRPNDHFADERFVPLAQMSRVMRGIATGANKFFVLSDAEVEEWSLNPAHLQPVLTKTREAPGYTFDSSDFERLGREGKKRWLLYLTMRVQEGTPEARYLRHGEAMGLHGRSLVKIRPFWYQMEQREAAPIYFTYLSRKKSRFIYNRAGVLALNAFLCVYPEPDIAADETALKALLAVLNSVISKDALRHVGRTYGGDTVKVEPRELDRLPVLNPFELDESDRERLALLFDKLCAASSREAEEMVRRDIDEAIQVSIHINEGAGLSPSGGRVGEGM